MKGTIIDFMDLAAEKPELAEELVELAARYDFEFTANEELSDEDLENVTGGTSDLQLLALQQKIQSHNRQITLLSNVMKARHDTEKNTLRNIRS